VDFWIARCPVYDEVYLPRTHPIYATAPSLNPWGQGKSYFPERLSFQPAKPDCWMEVQGLLSPGIGKPLSASIRQTVVAHRFLQHLFRLNNAQLTSILAKSGNETDGRISF
jgi:hypothetical protein